MYHKHVYIYIYIYIYIYDNDGNDPRSTTARVARAGPTRSQGTEL